MMFQFWPYLQAGGALVMGKNDIFMFHLHLCPITNINCVVVYRSVHSLHISTHIYCIHIIFVFIAVMFAMRTARAALLLGPW